MKSVNLGGIGKRKAIISKGPGQLKVVLMFLLASLTAAALGIGNAFSSYAAQIFVDPWKQYEAKDIAALYPQLIKEELYMINAAPAAYPDTPGAEVTLSSKDPFLIDLSEDAETIYNTMISRSDVEDAACVLVLRFVGDPSSGSLMKVDVKYQEYAGEDHTLQTDAFLENVPVIWDKVENADFPQAVTIKTGQGFSIALTLKSVCIEGQKTGAGERLDYESYMNDPRYEIQTTSFGVDYSPVGDRIEWGRTLGLLDYKDTWSGYRYSIVDTANGNRELVHQDAIFYVRFPEEVWNFFPEGRTYPCWTYHEFWRDGDLWGFQPNGEIVVSKDDRSPYVASRRGVARSSILHDKVVLVYDDNGRPRAELEAQNDCGWELSVGRIGTWGVGLASPDKERGSADQDKGKTAEEVYQSRIRDVLSEELEHYDGHSSNINEQREEVSEEFDIDAYTHVYAKHVHKTNGIYEGRNYINEDRSDGDKYVLFRRIPELPYGYLYVTLQIHGAIGRKTATNGLPTVPETDSYEESYYAYRETFREESLKAMASVPVVIEWSEPVWADAPGTSAGGEGPSDSIGGSLFDDLFDTGAEDPYDDWNSASENDGSYGDNGPYPYPLDTGIPVDTWSQEDWEEHADTLASAWRSFLGWVAALLVGGGVGTTIGGGLGGALGGAAGGFPGGSGEGPDGADEPSSIEDGSDGYDYDRQPPDDEPDLDNSNEGGRTEPGRRPWSYEDPSSLPKGWHINQEGDLSYQDPATGETMNYYLKGYDEETGEPQYQSAQNRDIYGEGLLRNHYESRQENAYTLSQDAATGKRWAEEQHRQNQEKWDKERETGVTDMSEAWKQDQQRMAKEEYLEKLADKYGKSTEDIKGIKKEILKERQKEAEEYGKQMAKDAWLGAAEDTASQIETASDLAVNVLGEVTGPAGKAVKNAYTFAKPGMTKLSESLAERKEVYDTMTAIAQGTAEGAIGVLQNEVDGFGMAVGGDLVKTGLDGIVQGKSAKEIAADMQKTFTESSLKYGISKTISSAGKKVSDKLTAGKTMELGKNIDAYGNHGVSWKNMATDTGSQRMAKMRLSDYKKMTQQIAKTESWTNAGTNLFNDLFQKKVTNEAVETLGDAVQADTYAFLNDAGEVIRKYNDGKL